MTINEFSETKQKIAVVDIGANSVRMNIYDVDIETGDFSVCDSTRSMLGLAAYECNGRLSPDGEGKLYSVLREYLARANSVPTDCFSAFATASLRGLHNSEKILAKIKNKLGIDIRVIGGDEEALFDFKATCARFGKSLANRGIVIDMGGGSTELVGFENNVPVCSVSLKLGCLALSKRYVKSAPFVNENERADITDYVNSVLSEHGEFKNFGGTAYLIGGTARAGARIFIGTTGKNVPTDGFIFAPGDFSGVVDTLCSDEAVGTKLVKKFAPDRMLTVIPGTYALREILQFTGVDSLTVSGAGVREGFLSQLIKDIQKNISER